MKTKKKKKSNPKKKFGRKYFRVLENFKHPVRTLDGVSRRND